MKKNRKLIIYSSISVVLVVGFFYALFSGSDNWKQKLPVMGYVEPFAFINQDADTVTNEFTKGNIYVANYFFVTCPGICPTMNNNLKKVYDAYASQPNFKLLSHTCQPEVDSIPHLKRYADSMQVDQSKWQFLTGNKLDLYNTARTSYHIDDPKNNVGSIEDQFLHSQFIALVDEKGQLRGIYDGLKKKELKALIADIQIVLDEHNTNSIGDKIFGSDKQ